MFKIDSAEHYHIVLLTRALTRDSKDSQEIANLYSLMSTKDIKIAVENSKRAIALGY